MSKILDLLLTDARKALAGGSAAFLTAEVPLMLSLLGDGNLSGEDVAALAATGAGAFVTGALAVFGIRNGTKAQRQAARSAKAQAKASKSA